jgi:rSAM/selenodomain-associated transferase 1
VNGALVIFAKAPRPGFVKTRMCPPLTPEQAATFYACMLDDVLEATASAAPRLGLGVVLAVHPAEAAAELAQRAPGFRVIAQRGDDLSQRMSAAAETVAAAGHRPVLLRGSDSPALGEDALSACLAALDAHDVALCPDRDGGYSLVGMRRHAPGLFDHAMSTGRVLEDTLARAAALGLRVKLLAPGFDLDTAADLHWLAKLDEAGRARCRRTLGFAQAHGLIAAQA